MSEILDVTIIVLNWNGRSYLEACLGALLLQTRQPRRIVLVDNNSTDDSIALVQRKFPTVEIVKNERNLGYAGGNNVVLRELDSDLAVLINPDIVVSRDWLQQMLAALEEDSFIGIAGCKLYYPGAKQLQHAGGLISHPRAMPAHWGMYNKDDGQFDAPSDVGFVTGAAVAVRRDALAVVGLLDEGFFMYFEDADWCKRARRAAFRVLYVPQATAIHDESAIAVRGSPSYLRRFHTGRWRYLLKHFDSAEILAETMAAEAAWLEEMARDERIALGWAYRDTAVAFPQIMAARQAHGAEAFSPPDQEAIFAAILTLRRSAMLWPDSSRQMQDLRQLWRVEPQHFSSATPVIGPLLARLRALWASVAAKPYVNALNEQQNDFNQDFLHELGDIENRLRAFRDVWMKQETGQRELAWEISALQKELDKTNRLLEIAASRMASLRENDSDG